MNAERPRIEQGSAPQRPGPEMRAAGQAPVAQQVEVAGAKPTMPSLLVDGRVTPRSLLVRLGAEEVIDPDVVDEHKDAPGISALRLDDLGMDSMAVVESLEVLNTGVREGGLGLDGFDVPDDAFNQNGPDGKSKITAYTIGDVTSGVNSLIEEGLGLK